MSEAAEGPNRREALSAMGLAGAVAGLAAEQAKAVVAAAPTKLSYATIRSGTGWGLGLRTPKGVIDVAAADRALNLRLPTSVDDVIHQRGNLAGLARLTSGHAGDMRRFTRSESGVVFGPCVTRPEKIVCVGLNYKAHVEEGGEKLPTTPVLFNKFPTSLNAHGGTIDVSGEDAVKFDYEAEMVIVIGKTARNVSKADALNYVFGYCTGQDFTARDLQMSTGQWMIGKCGDGWGPIGPWLVSADQIDPDNLDVKMHVNGELRQSSNTKLFIFDTRTLISFISRHITLKPGDVIFTGTPNGVIMGYPKEKQVWLKKGDVLVTSVQHLGEQRITLV